MSMVVVKPIDGLGEIVVSDLYNSYPLLSLPDTRILCFINRIFNPEKVAILAPKISLKAEFKKLDCYPYGKIILFPLMVKYGIAKGYFVEVIVTNIILNNDDKIVPIFPNELISDCDYPLKELIEKELKTIKNIGNAYELIGILHQKNLGIIADDFREAINRFEGYDYEGSIKFFRKVIEGLRKYAQDNVIETRNRNDNIKDFLSKTFHLMSNFGEHTGTTGYLDEAILSREITIAISAYISKKL